MSVPATIAKVVGALAVMCGGPASIYYSWDHITLHEVERKVMNEQVALKVGDKSGDNTPWTISVDTTASANDTNVWKEDVTGGGYYWKCVISGPSALSIQKTDLEALLPTTKTENDTTKLNNKKTLVYECSKGRDDPSTHNKITSKFVFPDNTTSNNWKTVLFGIQPTPAA